MKIFTLFMVAFAFATAPNLLAQHNKNFSYITKVDVKMNYAGEAIDIIINGKAVIEPEKFNRIKNALSNAAAIGWLQEFYGRTEFKIYFFCSEPNAKNFSVFEITDFKDTHMSYRETLAATKTTPDYTHWVDALYEATGASMK